MTPTLCTTSGPQSNTNGSCSNAAAQRSRSSAKGIPSAERPTKPIVWPLCSPNGSARSSPSAVQISALLPTSGWASSGRW